MIPVRYVALFLAMLLAFATVGCAETAESGDPGERVRPGGDRPGNGGGGGGGQACDDDDDCPGEALCIAGRCATEDSASSTPGSADPDASPGDDSDALGGSSISDPSGGAPPEGGAPDGSPCERDSECNDGNPCTASACTDGFCASTPVPNGTEIPDDRPGDCQRPVCTDGQLRFVPDNGDLPPDDGIECTIAGCRSGIPTFTPDSARCADGQVCWAQGGGCVDRDEVPANVCIEISHDYDYFLDPQCGDGIADEGCPCEFGAVQRCFMGPPTARGVGACADGTQVCRNRASPQWGPCTGSIGPSQEVCDGRDNACDGCVDNVAGCAPVVNCPDNEVSQPFRYYDLDATTFFGDVIEGVRWTVQAPPNSNRGFPENPNSPQTRFFMDVSGDYLVTIQIDDDKGTTYACSWIVSAQGSGLRVELVWDSFGSVDMDLHLQRHSATNRNWCNGANDGDCHFRNCRVSHSINWGYAATPDGEACGRAPAQTCPNPRLDIDNISGRDPENINIDAPNDGDRFRIMALMYSGRFGLGGSGPTHSVVSIYCGGTLTAVFGEAPDRVPIPNQSGTGCANVGWRVADVTMHVDPGTGRTTCSVDPIIVNGNWDLRSGSAF